MRRQDIPDLEVIDLEDTPITDTTATNTPEKPPRKKKIPINIHIVLAAVVLLTFAVILYKYLNFGQRVDPDEGFHGSDDYIAESFDSILPLTDADGKMIAPNLEDGLSIAIFGNGPFAEERNSEDGLAGLLAEVTGATVYNCSVSGSYLASTQTLPHMTLNPWDAFTFYWMALFTTDLEVNDFFKEAMDALGPDAPPEAEEVHEILSTVDFDTVDVIVIMYDAADYLAGRPVRGTEEIPGIQSFAGNLEAGIQILQQQHPNVRIIVMSPTYAFSDQRDENGSYISSDIVRYGGNVLSTYVTEAAEICTSTQVTFVDNFYVTFNEDNAADYLTDNIHLNSAGRKRVIDRLVYALNYFSGLTE